MNRFQAWRWKRQQRKKMWGRNMAALVAGYPDFRTMIVTEAEHFGASRREAEDFYVRLVQELAVEDLELFR